MTTLVRKLLLTPDASASRRVRTLLADKAVGLGVKVVTPNELIEELRLAYLIPNTEIEWVEQIREGMGKFPNSFWAESFHVDPVGTSAAVASALDEIFRNSDESGDWTDPDLSVRTASTLQDLYELWTSLEKPFPSDIGIIKAVKEHLDQGLYSFSIHHIENWPRLDKQLGHLVKKLNMESGPLDVGLQGILDLASSVPEVSDADPAPQFLAKHCFTEVADPLESNSALRFFSARDTLEEIECAVGATQSLTEHGVAPEKIGLLFPKDASYHRSVAEACALAGINIAGLQEEHLLRDLGGEVVRSLILIARGPVPKMAFAALMASSVAPWRQSIGNRLASYVMSGRFNLRKLHDMTEEEEKSLHAIRRLRANTISITDVIEVFAAGVEGSVHSARLRILAKQISENVNSAEEIDYDVLLGLVGHADEVIEIPAIFPQNGVRIFSEEQEPWCKVDHLFILGFNSGHYPSVPGASPVFHELEKKQVNGALGWDLPTADSILEIRRARFQRQMSSASQSLTFFAAARNIDGSPAQFSETATFIAGLFNEEPEDLFVPVHDDIEYLPKAQDASPASLRQIASADLNMGRDLLVLRRDADGNPRPESPSSLESLLVSPLAWLLGRMDALPDPWNADKLDALLQGNIAHGVFENLFRTDGELVDRDQVEDAVDDALAEVIRQQAPLLSTAQWKVERNTLRSTLIQAVKSWRDVLEELGAKVVGVEAPLKGEFDGIPLHGVSDEVVQLPGGKLAVVDFKKSSSAKRRERMELGYDCQVSLYEKMINDNPSELGVEGISETPGIIYYTLNDQRVIADDRTGLPNSVPGLIVVSNDVSENALSEISGQINKLKAGIIEMNHEGDASAFAKEKALPDFALEASPLVMMFAHPDPVEGEP